MSRLATLIFLTGLTIFCKAQGSWNIGYIQIDSITKEHVGRLVRLDFRSINAWTSPDGHRYIRSYVGAIDTGTLTIDTTLAIFVERRKIYVDHGDYLDQFLECINCKGVKIIIYDAKIIEVDQKSILFQLNIEIGNGDKVKRKETEIVTIDRRKLDGVMYEL